MTGLPQAAIDAARAQAREWSLGIVTRLGLNVDADTIEPLLEAVAEAGAEAAVPHLAAAERERILAAVNTHAFDPMGIPPQVVNADWLRDLLRTQPTPTGGDHD